jgi:hypothetical protein
MTDPQKFSAARKITFMQDVAPAQIMQILKEKVPRVGGKGLWPGNSPDLNPIEHIWSVLQQSVFKNPVPKDRDGLIRRVTETWNSLDVTFLSNLTRSFPNRILEVRKAGYGHSRY